MLLKYTYNYKTYTKLLIIQKKIKNCYKACIYKLYDKLFCDVLFYNKI